MISILFFISLSTAIDFKTWTSKHNKHFSAAETLRRRAIFNSNAKFVANFNKYNNKMKLSLEGPFAAMTNEEYKKLLRKQNPAETKQNVSQKNEFSNLKAATELDLRDQGVVPPIRSQGNCGACYAFGSLATLEGRLLFEKGGNVKTIDLAEQQLVDCSQSYGNNGCDGGFGVSAYEYIKTYGIMKESDYPYKQSAGTCSYKESKVYAKLTGYKRVTAKSPSAMKSALAGGMVGCAIDASSEKFQLYGSGVYQDVNCATDANSLNHEVAAVGYGTVNGVECIYIRNSYGTSWGDNGYIYMAMQANTCGVLSDPYYPTGVSYA